MNGKRPSQHEPTTARPAQLELSFTTTAEVKVQYLVDGTMVVKPGKPMLTGTVSHVAKMLGRSRWYVYSLIRAGDIKVVRFKKARGKCNNAHYTVEMASVYEHIKKCKDEAGAQRRVP